MNDCKAILVSSTNLVAAKLIGMKGTITEMNKGRFCFTADNGARLMMNKVKENTQLGDLRHPRCKELSFTTLSGSQYVFKINIDQEQLFDGCHRKDNQFLGFQK